MRKSVKIFCQIARYLRSRMFIRMTLFIVLLFIFLVQKYVASGASAKVNDIALLLLKSSIFVFSIIILFSIITTLIPYLLYRKSKTAPDIKFTYTGTNRVICELVCNKLLFPFMGTVKAGLMFDKQYDTQIVLKRRKHGQGSGKKNLTLPDIKNYELNKVSLSFQDFFRMFSFKITFRYKASVTILPVAKDNIELSKLSYSMDKDEFRTDTAHRKEGELLHFKHFEASDDIRRIVWTVYAKTRELIIRTVEMQNMYASRVDMYASFCNNYQNVLDKTVSDVFLNSYKTNVWEVYKSLKKDNEVQFVPDQKSKIAVEYQREVAAQISGMDWHANKIEEYPGNAKISLICVSSLIPAQEIEKILDKSGANTIVVFVSMKSSVGKIKIKDVVREIFTIPEKKKINWKWMFSNNRRQISNNDNAIRNTLISRKINYIEL